MAKFPDFLKEGDEIRIISPAGAIDPAYIDGAKKLITEWGYKPTEGMYDRAVYGRFAGDEKQRTTDLQQALDDPKVKAILCSRGGYGVAQIIDKVDFTRFKENPKWVIGFSDITILHQAIIPTGYVSVHSPMAKEFTIANIGEPVTLLHKILKGNMPTYKVAKHPLNCQGKAKGKLIGGNFAVFMGMRGTKFDFPYKNAILFIEDVGESPYRIDRMIQNLRISGIFSQISGLILGQFSDTEEDPEMKRTIYEGIYEAVKEYDIPVCFNFSAGHIDDNFPLVMGADSTLEVTGNGAELKFQTTLWKKAKDFIKK